MGLGSRGAGAGGRRWTLRQSLLVTMSSLAVVPLVIAGGSAAFLAREALVEAASAGLETTTGTKALALERWLADKISDTEVLAQSELMAERNPDTIRHSLRLARRQQDEFEAIAVVDPTGSTLAEDGAVGAELLEALRTRTRLARLQARAPDREVRLLVTVPLRESLGWLAATINLTPILSELSAIRSGPTTRTFLEPVSLAAASGTARVEAADGRRLLVSRRPLHNFEQVVVVATDLDEVLSPLGPLLFVLVALTALGMAMSVGAARWLTARRDG